MKIETCGGVEDLCSLQTYKPLHLQMIPQFHNQLRSRILLTSPPINMKVVLILCLVLIALVQISQAIPCKHCGCHHGLLHKLKSYACGGGCGGGCACGGGCGGGCHGGFGSYYGGGGHYW
ncbi:hypothetical protein M8J76_014483 [Diaphorina citri]|nr:hypothetical protein M8J76_014483 [Diaphorina citri]